MKSEPQPPQNRVITVVDGQRTEIYRGTIVDLGLEATRLPNGDLLNLEIVRHPGGAAILALDQKSLFACCTSTVIRSANGSGNYRQA